MLILVVNCGSSSAKYELFDVKAEAPLCHGEIERIGEGSSVLIHQIEGKDEVKNKVNCPNHHKAMEIIRDVLLDPEKGVIKDVSEVAGVGHRVVHGGEEFTESTLIDDDVIKGIEKFSELAPLHNPPALEGIRSCKAIFKDVPQVAVFDTAFHHSMSPEAFIYGLPYELYEKYGIRKYCFHGTSHRYVSAKAAEVLGKNLKEVNLITVHLGNGCSIAAVEKGKSIDTSMGFTPLEGLLMGTRSGDLDPALVTFVMEREGLSPEEITELMNKKSGLLGVSGVSNDMRDLKKAMAEGNKRAQLAYNMFVYRILKYIGAYSAVLGKVDAIVFTAGIGVHMPVVKETIEKKLAPLFKITPEFLIIPTNEELLIAKDTCEIVKG